MVNSKKIGLFGGSFDPIHNGHMALASAVKSEFKLDMVYFIPAKLPPHKTEKKLTPQKHRIKMIKLAAAGLKDYKISRFELKRKKNTTYTFETVRYFKKRFKHAKLYSIFGSDSVGDFEKWKNVKYIFNNSTVVAGKRAGIKVDNKTKFLKNVLYTGKRIPDVSSSKIRKSIINGKSAKGMVNRKVALYIRKNGLYCR